MKARTAQTLRTWHRYTGLFFTPAILFFSLSGALQTIELHEQHGAGPPPPEWIAWMAALHKEQSTDIEDADKDDHDKEKAAKAVPGQPKQEAEEEEEHEGTVALKAFTVIFSIALMASSLLGVVIALTHRAARRRNLIALGLGVVVPVLLALL